MRLTVKQMIEQGGFSDFRVLAGESGIETREVKTVCVVDVPDIEGWVYGGEFLLTSGYIFRDDPELLIQLIETANRYNAAALGVKLERYIERIPQNVLCAANAMSFPLIGIPRHYAHTDIINPVLIAMSDKAIKMMQTSDEIHEKFFNLMLSDGTVDSLLSLLNKYISREILFVDIVTGERHAFTTSLEFNQMIEDVPLASLTGHFPYEKIILNGKVRGYLFTDRPVGDMEAEVALNHAKEALQMSLKWEHERWKIERGRETQFVQDILYKRFRQDSEILSRGRLLNWDLTGAKVVVLVGIDRVRSLLCNPCEPYIRAFESTRSLLSELQDNIPYSPLENEMAFIVSVPDGGWRSFKENISRVFQAACRSVRVQTGLQLIMGIGSQVENITLSSKSFREASKVLAMAQQTDSGGEPLFWEDMGAYKFLSQIQDTPEAHDFIKEYLGKLMGDGSEYESDSLLDTLFRIIDNNWQLKPAADQMNLHYNTVKYRYRKIQEILKADIDKPSVRINLAFAKELYKINKSRKERQTWE